MESARRSAVQRALVCLTLIFACLGSAVASESAVTVLTGFEDNSVAVRIRDTKNVRATDCTLEPAGIPARTGHRSIKAQIGATVKGAEIGCSLLFSEAVPFTHAKAVAAYVCLYEGEVSLAFRIRDDRGALFQTPFQTVKQHAQFVRVAAELTAQNLKPLAGGAAKPTGPLEIAGFAVRTPTIGRQEMFIDDLQVEHRVPDKVGLIRGGFLFDRPTHLYEPGDDVHATLQIENLSREMPFRRLVVELEMLDSTGEAVGSERTTIDLPRSGIDYRSFQEVVLTQKLKEPGLYRFQARVRAAGWPRPARYASSIAALPSNRALPRGRETFFGVRTNTLRESLDGQAFEVALAREIGVQLLGLEVSWASLEPARDDFRFTEQIEPIVRALHERNIAVALILQDPPAWLPADPAEQLRRQASLIEALAKSFGTRVEFFQAAPVGGKTPTDTAAFLQKHIDDAGIRATVLAQETVLGRRSSDAANVAEVLEPGEAAAWRDVLAKRGQTRDGADRLLVRTRPLDDAGGLADAVDVLETLVSAARHDLAGVFWFDLRDDTVDQRYRETMRGLVTRDFSPKMPLVGYASAVGMLHGLRYVGPLENTPDTFESALFMGAERQVAILLPKPNRMLPAVLAPTTGEAGTLEPLDFERRPRPLIETNIAPDLVETLDRPMFLSFRSDRALKDPVLSLSPTPWLDLPGTVLLGEKATWTIRIRAPRKLARTRSRIQLLLPRNAPLSSSLSSRRLTANPGEELEIPVELTRTGEDAWFAPITVRVRVTLEGERVEVPVTIRPVGQVASSMGELGALRNGEDESVCGLQGQWSSRSIALALKRPDDLGADSKTRVWLVAEGQPTPAAVPLGDLWGEAPPKLPAGWKLKRSGDTSTLTLSPSAFGLKRLPDCVRIAIEVVEPSSLFAGRTWRFGSAEDPIWLMKAR